MATVLLLMIVIKATWEHLAGTSPGSFPTILGGKGGVQLGGISLLPYIKRNIKCFSSPAHLGLEMAVLN